MSVRADFSVGCSENGYFVVRETCCHEYGSKPSLRETLMEHLDGLTQRAHALREILATHLPEDAESLLLDATRMRIDEVTLKPPANVSAAKHLFTTKF